jgi:hypothetical protein
MCRNHTRHFRATTEVPKTVLKITDGRQLGRHIYCAAKGDYCQIQDSLPQNQQ